MLVGEANDGSFLLIFTLPIAQVFDVELSLLLRCFRRVQLFQVALSRAICLQSRPAVSSACFGGLSSGFGGYPQCF